jgi:hypothetical protein
MKLESVRSLKLSLTSSVAEPFTALSAAAARSIGLSAQPVPQLSQVRSFALGIAKKGKSNYRLAVRLQRRALESSPELAQILKSAKGEVDVRYIGRLTKLAAPWHQRKNRPLRVGGSIGHFRITAGTLGCFVRRRSDGQTLILSNNHVLADENKAKVGDAIIQPGQIDGGKKSTHGVGALVAMIRLKKTGANLVDAAVASIKSGITFNARKLEGLGDLAGLGSDFLDEGAEVAKVGRTTGTTRGRVTAFELDNVVVSYDLGSIRFDNQVEIEGAGNDPFSDGGDSGSLIVDGERRGVALLFAGGDQGGSNGKGLTYANPLKTVLDSLKVDLL